MDEGKLHEPHVVIRLFEDDTVWMTNEKGDPLEDRPLTKDEPGLGPLNTYDQILWHASSPICIWFRGKRR